MNIRNKLTIQFALIIISILSVFAFSIYYFSADYRQKGYYSRLKDQAYNTAKLLIDVEEIDSTLLMIFNRNTVALLRQSISVIDKSDHIIFSYNDTSIIYKSVLNNIRKHKEIYLRKGEREGIGIIHSYLDNEYIIIVYAYDKFGENKITNLKWILITGLLLSFIISIIGGYFYASRAVKPIESIVSQVNKITLTNLTLRVDEGNKTDEIARLAITFNQMLKRLEEALILERDFVSNASHELRTPLTVIIAELDFLLMEEKMPQNYSKTLQLVTNELKLLSEISNSLLHLAQLSFEDRLADFQLIRIDDVLINTVKEIVNLTPTDKIRVDIETLPENQNELLINGNEQLLKIAFKNLISNASKFSHEGTVDVIFSNNPESIKIEIIDKGIGIHKEDIELIFRPFFRGKNAKFIAGHGLGLPLTLKIIEIHKGTLTVKSEVDKGSKFIVLFQKAIFSLSHKLREML